jgi:hypothetical protein
MLLKGSRKLKLELFMYNEIGFENKSPSVTEYLNK